LDIAVPVQLWVVYDRCTTVGKGRGRQFPSVHLNLSNFYESMIVEAQQ